MRLLTVCSAVAAFFLTACGGDDSLTEEWGAGAEALTAIGVTPNIGPPNRSTCVSDKAGRGCEPAAAIAPVPGIVAPAPPPVVGDSSPDPIPAINPDRGTDERGKPPRGDCDWTDVSGGRKGCSTKPGRNGP